MAYRDVVLADSPVDYYEMNTGTGTDSGSGGRTLTLNGGITTGATGQVGNAWTFDGVNDVATMATFPSLTNAYTFEAWVKAPSPQGMTNDYPTIIRRDGTDIVLLRIRGSALGLNPGQAEIYVDGLVLVSGTSYRVDDGNWHHIVYTQSGNVAKLYVDGVERASGTTSQTTFNMGTGVAYVGGGNTAASAPTELFKGTMDEMAVYNTALSPTRIAEHYNSGLGYYTRTVNATADATSSNGTTWTETGDPIIGGVSNDLVRWQVPKSSLTAVGESILSAKLRVRVKTAPTSGQTVNAIITGGDGTTHNLNSTNYPANSYIEFNVASVIASAGSTVTVQLDRTGGSNTSNMTFYSVDAAGNEPQFIIQYENVPVSTTVDVSTVNATVQTVEPTVEVAVGAAYDADTPNVSAVAHQPVIDIINPVVVDLTVDTALVSVASNEATADFGTSLTVATATASVASHEATGEVSTSPDAIVDVSTAALVIPEPVADVSINSSVDVTDTSTVMLGAYDPTIELNNSAVVTLDTPRIDITHIRVSDVNGEPVLPSESEDRYFEATMDTLIGVTPGITGGLSGMQQDSAIDPVKQIWFRFNEASGAVVYDRLFEFTDEQNNDQSELQLSNVTLGLKDGPESRHHAYFNGDAYAHESPKSGAGPREGNIEFTFRTDKKNQFLMGNADVENIGLSTGDPTTWELWQVDGRLEVRTWKNYTDANGVLRTTERKTTGFKDYSDGAWHHVVLQNDWNQDGLSLYVDANLEIRRRAPAIGVRGFPDYIGGRPSVFYGATRAAELPRSSWFVGDLTEVVYRYGRSLSADEIARQRDTMFGIFPYYAEGPRITLKANDAVVKGNKPRLLVLHFGQMLYTRYGTFDMDSQAVSTGNQMRYGPRYDGVKAVQVPFIGWGENDAPNVPSYPTGDYLWDIQSVFGNAYSGGALWDQQMESYRDEVTDNYRLVDLEKDLNMEDYDVISLVGFPNNSFAWEQFYGFMDRDSIEPKIPATKQVENLMSQVREQVVHNRKGLYINDPFAAIAMGIVDRAEFVPNFRESVVLDTRLGAAVGYMDWHSYIIDPFNGANPETGPPNALERRAMTSANLSKASRYLDLHANVKQRVRTSIAGLTTVPAWVKTDHIVWQNLNPMNEPPFQESIAYENKPFGLSIGDEFYMEGGYAEASEFSEGLFGPMTRKVGWVATPIANIKVGSAVTTFAQSFYSTTDVADEAIGNPYLNHAISIAVQPGDLWDGEVVSGKVYVNFTEANTHVPEGWNTAEIMDVEVGDVIRFRDGSSFTIQPYHLKYNWSTNYGTWGSSEVNLPDTGGSGADWGWSAGGDRGSGTGVSGSGGTAVNAYWSGPPTTPIATPTMAQRAVKWLADNVDVGGNARVDVATATASVKAEEVTVEASRNTVVELSTARVQAEAFNDADTIDPDVSVLVGTAAVSVKTVEPVTEIVLSTATVTVSAGEPEPADYTIDWSEALVMTLPRQVLTLILEDN